MTEKPFISAHPDPEGEIPWGMQIVVEDTKSFSPLELAHAVAKGVTVYLDEAQHSPERLASINSWMKGRIRKVVRRAKNIAWDKVQDVDGLSYADDKVSLRVMTPTDMESIPVSVRKTQVSGMQTVDNELSFVSDPDPLFTIFLNRSLNMSPPKAAVAAAHAAHLMLMKLTPSDYEKWKSSGFAMKVTTLYSLDSPFVEFMSVAIHDGGLTEVTPGSVTAMGMWKE